MSDTRRAPDRPILSPAPKALPQSQPPWLTRHRPTPRAERRRRPGYSHRPWSRYQLHSTVIDNVTAVGGAASVTINFCTD